MQGMRYDRPFLDEKKTNNIVIASVKKNLKYIHMNDDFFRTLHPGTHG